MRLSIPTLVNIRVLGIPAFLSILALLPIQSAHAVTTEALSCTAPFQIVRTFPNRAKWEMCWEARAGSGYWLTQIIFTPPNGIRRKILDRLSAAQLFVPYDDNADRFHDLTFGTNLATLTAAECPGGTLLTTSTLCLVNRPTGYLFKNLNASAQGNSFAIFGYYGLGAYFYTFQYTFSDDGSIEPAVIASGSLQKFADNPPSDPFPDPTGIHTWPVGSQKAVNHNHLVIWRLDFDLDGSANNLVERISFAGTPGSDNRTMTVTPLLVEAKEKNNLANQTFWRVRNTDPLLNNSDGRSISYEIEPSVTDQLRTPFSDETFTQNDFYLTQYNAAEENVESGLGLENFVNGQTVTDVVAWYSVNFHHTPRGEDDFHMPAHSQGFRIRPRDVEINLAQGPVNNPPTITNPGPKTGTTGVPISNIAISASDPDGNPLTYSATGLPPGLAINSTSGLISGTPTTAGSFPGSTVTVNDGQGGSANASFDWTIAAGSVVTQTFSNSAAITIRDNTTAAPYPANVTVSGMSGNISKVVAKVNGLAHTFARDVDMLLVGPGGQRAILMSDAGGTTVINPGTNLTFDSGVALSVPSAQIATNTTYKPTDISTGGADSFPTQLLVAPATTYPANLNVFNGTAPNGTWRLYVFDDAAADTGTIATGFSLSITTTGPAGNQPPVVTNPGSQTGTVGTPISSLAISATDPEGNPLTFSVPSVPPGSLPPGLTITSAGVISGTPTTVGTFTSTVTVNDGQGGSANVSFGWTIAGVGGNQPPVVTNPGPKTGTVGTPISSLAISATDPEGNPLTFSVPSVPPGSLPPGLTITSAGVISGTPTTVGNFTSTVTVNDGQGGSANVSFDWTIAAGAGGTQTFSNSAAITIRDNTTATPYPANVTVSGMSGNITKVVVKVNGLAHTFARDIDMLLVGPGGQRTVLMSDAGGTTVINPGTNLTFDSGVALSVPSAQIATNTTYKPTDISTGGADSFPTQLLVAPATTYPANLNVFNGTAPNGTWRLYVFDDAAADTGTIATGFSLTITTQ